MEEKEIDIQPPKPHIGKMAIIIGVVFVFTIIIATFLTSSIGAEENVSISLSIKEESDAQTTYKNETVSYYFDFFDEPNVTAERNDEYNDLLEQLNAKLAKRDFPDQANKTIRDILDGLWNKYSDWEKGYFDMPSKYDYIKSNLIDNLDNVKEIIWYDYDSAEGQKLIREGEPSGLTDWKFRIQMILSPDSYNNADLLYHEIAHCKQHKVVYGDEYFEDYEDMYDILIEGGATFHMKFLETVGIEPGGAWGVENEDGSEELHYVKEDCSGYLIYLSAYEKLVYLAGYETIQEFEKGRSVAIINDAIAERYDKETADKIFTLMGEQYNLYEESYKSDEIYNTSIELEKEFLNCVKCDIKKIGRNDTELLKKYKDFFEVYKLKFMPMKPINDTEYAVCEKFNISEIDDLLANKEQEMENRGGLFGWLKK